MNDRDLVATYSTRGPRYTSYPPVPYWSDAVTADDYVNALAEVGQQDTDLRLYVHVPFCASRCWYCACNVSIQVLPEPIARYVSRLSADIAAVSSHMEHRRVTSLHIGGGTPNVLSRGQIDRLVGSLENHFDFAPDAQRSIEVDARLLNDGDTAHLVHAGFSRLSFGVQDLNPRVGVAIGRVMSGDRLESSVAEARAAGARGINVDLLYGLPHQTPESITQTLSETVRRLAPDRMAFYGYAHVPSQRPQQRRLERAGLPDEAARAALEAAGRAELTAQGYLPLGMDHFARASDSLFEAGRRGTLRRSFMGYTTDRAPNLIGFGASAIGHLATASTPLYVQNHTAVKAWERAEPFDVARGYALGDDDVRVGQAIHDVMCHLAAHSPSFWNDFPGARERLDRFENDGLVVRDDQGFRVTDRGRFFVRPIAMQLDPRLHEVRPQCFSATG